MSPASLFSVVARRLEEPSSLFPKYRHYSRETMSSNWLPDDGPRHFNGYGRLHFCALSWRRHHVERILDISTETSIPTCVRTISGMLPLLSSHPVCEGRTGDGTAPSALSTSAVPRRRRATSTRSSRSWTSSFPGKRQYWEEQNMDPFQLRVLMGDVPLFCALLLPALRAGGARYVFQVASPINWSYVLIPPPRITSLTSRLLWQDTVGMVLCDRAWHYDINGPKYLDCACEWKRLPPTQALHGGLCTTGSRRYEGRVNDTQGVSSKWGTVSPHFFLSLAWFTRVQIRVTTESYGVGTIEGCFDECRLTISQVSV